MSAKGTRLSPEQRAKIGASNRRAYADPALRAKMSDLMRQNWQNPEYRAATLAARRARPVQSDEERKATRRAYYERNRALFIERARLWYQENIERARERNRLYQRENAEAARERYERWMSVPENRAKSNAASAAYIRAHPELRQKYSANRRARLLGQFVEEVDRTVVLARYNGLCGICGDTVDPERFDVDHIIPLLVGGEHSYANTQPAHPSCNYRKPKRPKEIAA